MSEQTNELTEMTLGEVTEWELLTGTPIDDLMSDKKPRGRSLTATVYIIKKRTDPNFTMEDASKFTMTEAFAIMSGAMHPKA